MTLHIDYAKSIESMFLAEIKTYRKIATVRAMQIDVSFQVLTQEGMMKGNPGDYLCQGIEGEKWPIKKEIFEKTYKEVK